MDRERGDRVVMSNESCAEPTRVQIRHMDLPVRPARQNQLELGRCYRNRICPTRTWDGTRSGGVHKRHTFDAFALCVALQRADHLALIQMYDPHASVCAAYYGQGARPIHANACDAAL
jgi:hypothetical protein